jgi:hypothetical protein
MNQPTDNQGRPLPTHPGSGSSCREQFEKPFAMLADGSLILIPLGLLAGRKRLRMLFAFLSARWRRRLAPSAV